MFDPFVKGWEVFSAHAEVVPKPELIAMADKRILRARGGSSAELTDVEALRQYSPRTRR